MKNSRLLVVSVTVGGLSLAAATITPPVHDACAQRAKTSFNEDIAPIFKGYCISCHQPGGQGYEASGLDLTSYDGIMKGTKFGPMVIPGQPDNSNLFMLISGRAKIRMPFGHKEIPSCLQDIVYSWIFQGAQNN
jgi:Planctomycete cytochrome C